MQMRWSLEKEWDTFHKVCLDISFHKKARQWTNRCAGSCLCFMIKVVGTTHFPLIQALMLHTLLFCGSWTSNYFFFFWNFVFAELACGSSCDEYFINGQLKPEFEERASYGYAQKMRAAATYLYARLLQLGSVPWHKSELTGKMVGNPSISKVVSTYMLSLRRRKVRLYKIPLFFHSSYHGS